ncbi:MAG: DUF401 family protein [Bacillota bacterium]|nr:DUF401 family protein [Bacillota bacterium]
MNFINPAALEGAGVIISIFIIIFFIRKGWKMYYVLPMAIIVLAITNGDSLSDNLAVLYKSATSFTAFYLVTMVLAITMLGHLHHKIGAMSQLVDNLRLLIRDPRILIMVLPASISLFSTIPGGAILSAPMVEETGRKLNMPPTELAMSNLLYRHLIVLVNPFNAAIVLASGITGISIARYLGFAGPVIFVAIVMAIIMLFRKYPRSVVEMTEPVRNGKRQIIVKVLIAASPFIVAIFLGVACKVFFPLALTVGILITMLINLPKGQIGPALIQRLGMLIKGFNWPIALTSLTIVFYKDFILEAEAFQQFVQYLMDQGLPLIVLVVVLSFLTGFITGNNIAAIGIAIPIIMPFLGADMFSIRYLGLAYLCAYAGYLGSPIHLCIYFTNEYFKTSMYTLLKRINLYTSIIVILGLIAFLFY